MDIHTLYNFLGSHFRKKRMRDFSEKMQPTDGASILDIGGYPRTWFNFPNKPSVITLNTHPVDFDQTAKYPLIKTTIGDGCKLDYPDAFFDIIYSNSVIEHLSTFDRQQAFANEARRVGQRLWIQTPAKEFFIEPHLMTPFIHYLPIAQQRRLIRRFTTWGVITKPSPAKIETFLQEVRLLSFTEMQTLFPDCEIQREIAFGLTKSYIAVRL